MYVAINEGGVYRGYWGSYSGLNNEDVDFGTGSGNYIGSTHLVTNASPKLTVTYPGDVGIGTQLPSAKLDVIGKTRTDSFQLDIGATKGHILQSDSFGNAYWSDPDTISDGDWEFSGIDMYNANSGAVGIGTSTPYNWAGLTVTDYYAPAVFDNTYGSGMYVAINEGGVYRGYWGSYAGLNNEDVDFGTGSGNYIGSTHLVTNASPKLTVTYPGDVGIGTQTPTAKLDVVGKTKTDSLQIGETSTVHEFDWGIVAVGADNSAGDSDPANGQMTFTHTFPTAYTTAPAVQATVMGQTGTSYPDAFAITVRSVSTTQVVFQIKRVDATSSWGQNLRVSWMAYN